MSVVGDLVVRFTADMTGLKEGIAQYGRELDKAEKENADFNKGLSAIYSTITEVVAGFTAAAIAIGLMITATTKFGNEMIKASYITGLTTTQLQQWKAAGIETNVSFEGLVNTARMLTSRMGDVADGGSEISKAMKSIGVSAYDANGDLKDTDTLMWDIVNGLAKQPAGVERNTKAVAILGRSWYEIAPLIEKAEDAQKSYSSANVISPERIKTMEKYGTAIERATDKMGMMSVMIGEKLLPWVDFLTPKIDELASFVEEMAYQWDVAQYKASLFYTLNTLQFDKFKALVTAGAPKRPENTTPSRSPSGNTFKADLGEQEKIAKDAADSMAKLAKEQEAAQENLNKLMDDYVDAIKDAQNEKDKLNNIDKDYAREMSTVGWDVGKARSLTMQHTWDTQDQQGRIGQAQNEISKIGSTKIQNGVIQDQGLTVGGNLVLNIPGYTGSLKDAVDQSKELAKQVKVAGIQS